MYLKGLLFTGSKCFTRINILFIASSSLPLNSLPKQLKFYYINYINCANQNTKYELFKFLTDKFGIIVNMPKQDLMNFVYQNLRNYSNYDVFQVVKNGFRFEETKWRKIRRI